MLPSPLRHRLGTGWTLPTFFAAAAKGEVAEEDDESLVALMAHDEGDQQLRRASLCAFRAADLGREPLSAG